MHWFKLKNGGLPFINLNLVNCVYFSEKDCLVLCHGGQDYTDLTDPEDIAAILARLDALAEIATARTADALPSLESED